MALIVAPTIATTFLSSHQRLMFAAPKSHRLALNAFVPLSGAAEVGLGGLGGLRQMEEDG